MGPFKQTWWSGQAIFNELRLISIRQRHHREVREYFSDDEFVARLLDALESASQRHHLEDAVACIEEWLLYKSLQGAEQSISPHKRAYHQRIMQQIWEVLSPILWDAGATARTTQHQSRRSLSSLPTHASGPHASLSGRSGRSGRSPGTQRSHTSIASFTPPPASHLPGQRSGTYPGAQRSHASLTLGAATPMTSAPSSHTPMTRSGSYARTQHSRPPTHILTPPPVSRVPTRHSDSYPEAQRSYASISTLAPPVSSNAARQPGADTGSQLSYTSIATLTPPLTPPPGSHMPARRPGTGRQPGTSTGSQLSYTSIATLTPPPASSHRSVASLEHVPGWNPEVPAALYPAPASLRDAGASRSEDALSFPPPSMQLSQAALSERESGECRSPGMAKADDLSDAGCWKPQLPTPQMRPAKGWWNSESLLTSLKLRLARRKEYQSLYQMLQQRSFARRFLIAMEKAAKHQDCETAQLAAYKWVSDEKARVAGFEAELLWSVLNSILQSYADALMNPHPKRAEADTEHNTQEEQPESTTKEKKNNTQAEFQRVLDQHLHRLANTWLDKKK